MNECSDGKLTILKTSETKIQNSGIYFLMKSASSHKSFCKAFLRNGTLWDYVLMTYEILPAKNPNGKELAMASFKESHSRNDAPKM